MLVGFFTVEPAGDAPGNDQIQLVGVFVLKSVKLMQLLPHKVVLLAMKFATGGLPAEKITIP